MRVTDILTWLAFVDNIHKITVLAPYCYHTAVKEC